MTTCQITVDDARQLVTDILQRHQTSPKAARLVARALVAAEIDGQRGHGLSRVASYAAQAASGKVDGFATPVVRDQRPAACRIDAGNGFAFPACELAVSELITLAETAGVAAASIYRSHHFGQAGFHAEQLAAQGLVALVFGNSPQAIAPWGGRRGLFGTNPIAFAAPRTADLPLLIDLSLSKVARGKVMVAKHKGESIPPDWALDAAGQPTTDPDEALQGTMLPMGDAKGAALVLMVEILAAGLTGANFGYQASSFFSADGPPPGVGQFLIAFDPAFFSGGSFQARLSALIDEILHEDGVRLPGAGRRVRRQQAEITGLEIPQPLMRELESLRE